MVQTEKKNRSAKAEQFSLAPGQGFEPRYRGPEPRVLPLDDPGINFIYRREYNLFNKKYQYLTQAHITFHNRPVTKCYNLSLL